MDPQFPLIVITQNHDVLVRDLEHADRAKLVAHDIKDLDVNISKLSNIPLEDIRNAYHETDKAAEKQLSVAKHSYFWSKSKNFREYKRLSGLAQTLRDYFVVALLRDSRDSKVVDPDAPTEVGQEAKSLYFYAHKVELGNKTRELADILVMIQSDENLLKEISVKDLWYLYQLAAFMHLTSTQKLCEEELREKIAKDPLHLIPVAFESIQNAMEQELSIASQGEIDIRYQSMQDLLFDILSDVLKQRPTEQDAIRQSLSRFLSSNLESTMGLRLQLLLHETDKNSITQEVEKALKSNNAETLYRLGQRLQKIDPQKAELLLEHASQGLGDYGYRACYLLGQLKLRQKDKANALHWFSRANDRILKALAQTANLQELSQFPGCVDIFYQIGHLKLELHSSAQEGRFYLEKAAEFNHPVAQYELGQLLESQGEFERVKGLYEQSASQGYLPAREALKTKFL